MRRRRAAFSLALIAALALADGRVRAQIDPRSALLERAAWDALDAGHVRTASEAFREAIAGDPRNARLHLGAALAASRERRDADAKSECERALTLNPALDQARSLLGQMQYRLGDLAGAMQTYEALADQRHDGRGGAGVRETLGRWRRESELHDRMQQAIGDHFTVSFAGPEEAGLAAHALDSLDRAYWRIGQALSAYPNAPIGVVLYTAEQFRDITRSPAWAAGAYDGTIRVPMRGAIDEPEELDRVLAHEFTHALIRTLAARGVPTWLNEGLAAALESTDLGWAGMRASAARPVPLTVLQSGFGRLSGDEAQLAYATSALAARRLLDEAGGVAVANLLRDLGDGAAFESAFLRRIQRPFADFQAGPF